MSPKVVKKLVHHRFAAHDGKTQVPVGKVFEKCGILDENRLVESPFRLQRLYLLRSGLRSQVNGDGVGGNQVGNRKYKECNTQNAEQGRTNPS